MFKQIKSFVNTLKSKWLAQNLDYLTNNLVNYMANNNSSNYILGKFETLAKAENFEETKTMLYHVATQRLDANGKQIEIKGGNLLHIACATDNLELAEKLISWIFCYLSRQSWKICSRLFGF